MFIKKTFNECESVNFMGRCFSIVAILKCICRRDLCSAFVKEYPCDLP